MVFLTKENQYISFDLTFAKLIGEGAFGKVFLLTPEKCLKVISDPESLPDSEKIITFLREHNLPSFYEIYNDYYNRYGILNAYEMKYYEKSNELLLYNLMEFYLENFSRNWEDINKLSANGIRVCDLRGENVVLTSEKIVIIDADCFSVSNVDKNIIAKKNQTELKWLYINLLLREILDVSNYKSDIMSSIRKGLVSTFMDSSPKEIYEQLKNYQRPVDLVRRLERKK